MEKKIFLERSLEAEDMDSRKEDKKQSVPRPRRQSAKGKPSKEDGEPNTAGWRSFLSLSRFLGSPPRPLPLLLFSLLVMLVSTIIVGLIAFGLTIRNLETVKVPNLENELLVDALLQLQERGLVPSVQLRYFSDPLLKDRIVIHRPGPGSVVRVGRRINLVVSKGIIVDVVNNYVGRQLNDVQLEIQGLFSAFDKILRVNAISYVFDERESGLILEQTPKPGTPITGQAEINFVVSRGSEVEERTVGSYIGMYFSNAVSLLAERNLPFRFHLASEGEEISTASEGEEISTAPGTVVSQIPESDRIIKLGTLVELTMEAPSPLDEKFFGIFLVDLPSIYAPVDVRLVSIYPDGSEHVVFTMKHSGGSLSIPYLEPENTELIFYQLETEVKRLVVRNTAQ